ncbi:MAG: hypothetical protein AB1442_02795 [Nitrospirota bacterium]
MKVTSKYNLITPASKYQNDVIPRLDPPIKSEDGIHKGLDAPIKSEHDIFHLFNCRSNKIYGKLKFDAIYDTNNLGTDEFIKFVPRTANGEDKSTFNVRDTRLGVAIEGPALNGWT